jgi:PAS domain S-box-containing protein
MVGIEHSRPKNILKLVVITTVLLVAAMCYFGFSAHQEMKEKIREVFNAEQLVLAKITAQRIEGKIQEAITDLILLNSLPSVQYGDPESYETLLLSTLPMLNSDNLVEIRRVDRNGVTLFAANDQGIGMKHLGLPRGDAGLYLSWASGINNRGRTMGTSIRTKDPSIDTKDMVMDLIVPTYEDSGNRLHPRPSHGFGGYLKATLDVSQLLRRIMPAIRSGKTGYAWVLDSSGVFLYHPEGSFVGEHAFEVRKNRNPNISFAQINDIQRNEMLEGKEGVGSYLSGWHRDVIGPMEKLIAYAPVRIKGPYMDYIWSVAVVVPIEDVEGIIGYVYGRQLFFQGLLVLFILVGAAVVVLHEWQWLNVVERKAASKTDDLHRYANELENSEARFRSLAEHAEDLIFTLDGDGIIATMNHYMSRLFGVSTDELAGQSLYCLLPLDQTEEQLKLINQVLRFGEKQSTETAFTIHDQDFWFSMQYIPMREEGSGEEYVLAIGRDVTERKSLEKQLINTEKLASLGTLASGVAHEINNPLGIMIGFCDLLLEKMEPGTMEYNDLKTIERHGLHCKSIIERLLNFARISEETEEYCNLNASVEAILAVVKHTLAMNDIQLISSYTMDAPIVGIDSKGLQQVLLNLVSNAIHAIDGRGVLKVTTRYQKESGRCEVEVLDTGCGIKKEFMPRIFDPFFTTKKVGEGTGLGLSVSYGIVTQCGGSIECESYTARERPGNSGTTFIIRLPFRGLVDG